VKALQKRAAIIASERDTDTQSTRDNPLNQDTQDPTPTLIPTHTLTPDKPIHLPRNSKNEAGQAHTHQHHAGSKEVSKGGNGNGKVEVKIVGPGSDPSKNRERMGDDVPVMGPGMLPAMGPPGQPSPVQQAGRLGGVATAGRGRR
jgi:hypothetical protein